MKTTAARAKSGATAPGAKEAGPAAMKRIALIEDDSDIAYTIRLNLRKEKRYQVEHYISGLAALSALQEKPFDLVILDLNLPKKSGEVVLQELRSDYILRKIPVVIFSSSRSNRDIARSYELGANCYLSKPGTLVEFVSTVQLIVSFFGASESDSKGERWISQNPTYC